MSNDNTSENMENEQVEKILNLPIEKIKITTTDSESEREECRIDERKPQSESAPTDAENGEKSDKNAGVAIKHMENESFNSLLAYESDSSSSSEIMNLNLNWQVRNDSSECSSDPSLSDSDNDSDSDVQSVPELESPHQNKGAIKKKQPPKAEEELALEQLPPVPDISKLNISVENENFEHMGNVMAIVDKLVTVAAIPNTPAYDLDTLLFLDDGKRPLGFVFDVLGQVTSPIYAVRFNSVEDIKNLEVEVGAKVFSAPSSKHTQYVFLQQLLKMRGSDASWLGDSECPPEFADFSDDENERCQHRGNKRHHPQPNRSQDSHKQFETTMNKRNILNTRFNKYMDTYKQSRIKMKAKSRRPQNAAPAVPAFDPTIPPPTWGAAVYPPPQAYGYYAVYPPAGGNNNAQGQGYYTGEYMNNFVANLSQSNYYVNNPGPSHQ